MPPSPVNEWPEGVEDFVVDSSLVQPFLGCFEIKKPLAGSTLPSLFEPYLEVPGYPGLPRSVVIDTTRATWGGLLLRAFTPEHAGSRWAEAWGLMKLQGDTLIAYWNVLWGFTSMRYRMTPAEDGLQGTSGYFTDAVGPGVRRRLTRWRRIDCESPGDRERKAVCFDIP